MHLIVWLKAPLIGVVYTELFTAVALFLARLSNQKYYAQHEMAIVRLTYLLKWCPPWVITSFWRLSSCLPRRSYKACSPRTVLSSHWI